MSEDYEMEDAYYLDRFKCDVISCGSTFTSRLQLVNHLEGFQTPNVHQLALVHKGKMFCFLCGKRYKNENSLDDHELKDHINCSEEKRQDQLRIELNAARLAHGSTAEWIHCSDYFDEECPEGFWTTTAFYGHVMMVHRNHRIRCRAPGCHKYFVRQGARTRHEKMAHPNQELGDASRRLAEQQRFPALENSSSDTGGPSEHPYPEIDNRIDEPRTNEKSNASERFKCTVQKCTMKFTTRFKLVQHCKNSNGTLHKEEQKVAHHFCFLCGRRCRNEKTREKHEREKHLELGQAAFEKPQLQTELDAAERIHGERRLHCSDYSGRCQERVGSIPELHLHFQVVHRKKVPCRAYPECYKTFLDQASRTRHENKEAKEETTKNIQGPHKNILNAQIRMLKDKMQADDHARHWDTVVSSLGKPSTTPAVFRASLTTDYLRRKRQAGMVSMMMLME
ncbi:hypothetical protein T439DRAFT_326813 [Meredithblackwellia eburnea MCA 4105]